MALPPPPARKFASDNAAGAHPLVMEALLRCNEGHELAYGADQYTKRAEHAFSELFGSDVVTRFVYGGTGANVFALACMLQPAQAVVCTSWAHIAVDETGSPERLLGTKLIDLPSADAKLRPEQLLEQAHFIGSEHHVQPGVVSITQTTELGTVYSAEEVRSIADVAHGMGMLVHMDGARIAHATASLGATREALRSFTIDAGVDVLSFGGMKAGGVFGEAVIFFNRPLADRSKFIRKQLTQLHSKMRFISAQYEALLENDLFIQLGVLSNAGAQRLHSNLSDIPSLGLTALPAANSLFPTLGNLDKQALQEWSFFWDWDEPMGQVRWMTGWDVTSEDVDQFAAGVRAQLHQGLRF
jgi:threonine aldolase